MASVSAVAFWVIAFLGVYSYAVYPGILALLPTRRTVKRTAVAETWRSLSVIITAHNEASRIRAKIENVLALPTYPGPLEVIVASDASTDGTDEAVRDYASRGIRLVRNNRHEGKEAAQALAISAARGEILVFSDVATAMKDDVLRRIVDHFADPVVGAISSTDKFVDRGGNVAAEGAYVRYEMRLRREESRTGSLVGLSGSFFAVRAEICRRQWLVDVPSDFLTAVNCVRQGYIAVSAEDVVGYYPDLADPDKEYARKVRTVVRGMRALTRIPEVLNPLRHGRFAFQIWSHKVMRWAAPWFLMSLLPLTVLIAPSHPIYRAALGAQLTFYGLAAVGFFGASARRHLVVRIPHYFVVTNAAVMHAAVKLLRGKTVVTWVPSERQ